jgi:hypothetical protein
MFLRLNGKDQVDIDNQIREWREQNPQFRITKIHLPEQLPLVMSDRHPPLKSRLQIAFQCSSNTKNS